MRNQVSVQGGEHHKMNVNVILNVFDSVPVRLNGRGFVETVSAEADPVDGSTVPGVFDETNKPH